MFSPEERQSLRDVLVAAAREDARVVAAAVTGSVALGREDRWSDIDLALRLSPQADEVGVSADWTARMYGEHGAVDHLDVWRGSTRFRVFLLANTLQVDLAFWGWDDFAATGPAFRLLFGQANDKPVAGPPAATELIGMSWLYALHARSSLARGRVWQAEYMVSGLRDQALALACLRFGLPAVQGRGLDDLPREVTAVIRPALVRDVEPAELGRALAAAVEALLFEAAHADTDLVDRLAPVLRELVSTSIVPPSS